jgi:hypothetical protein
VGAAVFLTAAAVPGPASANPGDLTFVAGQGPTDACFAGGGQLGSPHGYTDMPFNNNAGIGGLAVTAARRLFVAAQGLVLDADSVVAGGGTTPADAATGSEQATSVALGNVTGVAVNPLGTVLWISEQLTDVPGSAGRVRRVNLQDGTITTIAGAGTLTGPAAEGRPASKAALNTPKAIATDGVGNVYVADAGVGNIYKIDTLGNLSTIGHNPAPLALAVDASGSQVFVSDKAQVYRLDGTAGGEVVAGGGSSASLPGDPPGPATNALIGVAYSLAVDNRVSADGVEARYLYIGDIGAGHVYRVDLATNMLTTVAGGGTAFQTSGTATDSHFSPTRLAVDYLGNLIVAAANECAILRVETPPAIALQPPGNNPPAGPPNNVKPDDPKTIPDPKETPGPGPATNNVTPQAGGSSTAADPKTAIINSTPSNAVNPPAPNSATPANAAVGDGGVTQAVTPGPAPVGPVASPNPGPGGVLGPPVAPQPVGAPPPLAPVPPAAGAPAPVPVPAPPPAAGPAAGTSPPPAAPQPVANVGLAGPGGDAPIPKGAARYAMVRADDDSSTATLAMAVGALALAAFLCVLFVAPGASSRPKPRPKGAY